FVPAMLSSRRALAFPSSKPKDLEASTESRELLEISRVPREPQIWGCLWRLSSNWGMAFLVIPHPETFKWTNDPSFSNDAASFSTALSSREFWEMLIQLSAQNGLEMIASPKDLKVSAEAPTLA